MSDKFDNIPNELKKLDQWVCWRNENGAKVPKIATGRCTKNASTRDPETWRTFEDAIAFARKNKVLGIGLVFTEDDDFIGVDLDNKQGLQEIDKDHQVWITAFDSYTERSPSGKGYHIILKGDNIKGFNKSPYEAYSMGRYFAFTGDVVHAKPINGNKRVLADLIKTFSNKEVDQFVLPEEINVGNRNDTLFRHACSLYARGVDKDKVTQIITLENRGLSNPLPEQEITALLKSAISYKEKENTKFHLTDVGNAERFVTQHGEDVRYVPQVRGWYQWDGILWKRDEDGEVMRRAKATARSIYTDVANETDDTRRKCLRQHANASESEPRLNKMIKLVEPELPLPFNKFDTDSMLLGVRNGTVNLRSGKLRTSDRGDYISKLADVDFNQKETCPLWHEYLQRIFNNDKSIINYLQRAVGYTLTGETGEQIMFILLGIGANGKTVFLNTVLCLLADYGTQADPGTLMVDRYRSGATASPDIARLRGARFVATSEAEEGKQFSENLIKQHTGGDTVVARHLYSELFEFIPNYKIWMATNHKPIIKGDDNAIWRRIHLIPFNVTIPPEERDRNLVNKLRNELPGILNWAIKGCLTWQRSGLKPPKKVLAATENYREEMDVMGQWLNDNCEIAPEKNANATALYTDYLEWATDNTGWTYKQTMFGRKLAERGFTKRRTPHVVYEGIGLKRRTRMR